MGQVNKIDGSLAHVQPLVTLPGQNGLGIGLALTYTSNIVPTVTTWNREAPTDIVGLGWKLPLTYILREPMHTADQDDDVYMLIADGSGARLKLVSDDKGATTRVRTYRTSPVSFNEITRTTVSAGGFYTSDVWAVTDGSGLSQRFGGAITRPDFENYASDGNSIEWEVVWGAWSGPTNVTRDAANARAQQQQPIVWNLRSTTNSTGKTVVYDYTAEEVQVGNDGGLRYTRCVYLTGVTMNPGYRVELTYLDKAATECPPKREWKASTTNPAYKVTQHQVRLTTKFLDTISIYNQTDFDVSLVGTKRLNYSAVVGDTANPKLLNSAIPEMAKRLLLSVHDYDRFGVETGPPLKFSYYGQDGQAGTQFVVDKKTSTVFDTTLNGIYGALRATTDAAGSVTTYLYEPVRADNFSTVGTFQDNARYGSDNNFFTFFYSHDVAVMVTRTGSSGNAVLNFKLFGFNGTWGERWKASCPVHDLRGSMWWTSNWQLKLSGNFMMIAVDSASIKSGSFPLIVYRDPTNDDKWLEYGTAPAGFATYYNYYRDTASWVTAVSLDLAAVYNPSTATIHHYRFDDNVWSESSFVVPGIVPGAASDIVLHYGALFHFAITGARTGRLSAWRLKASGPVQLRAPMDVALGAVDYPTIGHVRIDAFSNHIAVFYVQDLPQGFTGNCRFGAISITFSAGYAGYNVAQLVDRQYFNYEQTAAVMLEHQPPRTCMFVSNNIVSVVNGYRLIISTARFYTMRWRYSGKEWLYSEVEEQLTGGQIFASSGFENIGLDLDSSFSGAMKVVRFNPRDMQWASTGIVGHAMSDWELSWKIALIVMNVVSLPLGFIPVGTIGNALLFAIDVAVMFLEIAFAPNEVDINLGFGEDPDYLFSARSVILPNDRYTEVFVNVHDVATEEWTQANSFLIRTGSIDGTSALALTDRGMFMQTQGMGPQNLQHAHYIHAANGVKYSVEEFLPDSQHNSRHVDAGHDVIGSIESRDLSTNTVRLYRYCNRSWQSARLLFRTKSIVINDGYQDTKISYSYNGGDTYPVRLDASAGMTIYNKVTEIADDSGTGSVETYIYNGFSAPPYAPSTGNALANPAAVIGATYHTRAIPAGATGPVSSSTTSHQVYAIDKGGDVDYLALEIGSVSETDAVVTSTQVSYDLVTSGNPREARSFAGLPDLSREHQASRTTYAHEVPAYAAFKAAGFLDGPARADAEIRNALATTATKQFSTSWWTDWSSNGKLDTAANFLAARGSYTSSWPNRLLNLYKTSGTSPIYNHVFSDVSDAGDIVNGGILASFLKPSDAGVAPSATLIGPRSTFTKTLAAFVGKGRDPSTSGALTDYLEIVQADLATKQVFRFSHASTLFPKVGFWEVNATTANIAVATQLTLTNCVFTNGTVSTPTTTTFSTAYARTSPVFAASDRILVGRNSGPGRMSLWGTSGTAFPSFPGTRLCELAIVRTGTATEAYLVLVGSIRGSLLDVLALSGATGAIVGKVTLPIEATPTLNSIFATALDPAGNTATVYVLQSGRVTTLRLAATGTLSRVDVVEGLGTALGSPVINSAGDLALAVAQGASRFVVTIAKTGRLASTWRLDDATYPGAAVTAPVTRAGSAVAVLGTTTATGDIARLVALTGVTATTPKQVQATTWDTSLRTPIANYAWRGTGSPDFDGWTGARGTDYADWLRSDAVLVSDTTSAVPLEVLSTDKVVSSSILGQQAQIPVAAFSSGSVRKLTAYFTAFETYEKPIYDTSNANFSLTETYTGRRAFVCVDQVLEIARASEALDKETGPLVLTAWVKSSGRFLIKITGINTAITADCVGESTNGQWAKLSCVIKDFDKAAAIGATLSIGVFNNLVSANVLYIDNISLAPLGASVQAVVRDPVTFAPVASIDGNGAVVRVVNDHFDRPVAAVGPDGNVLSMSAVRLSRQRTTTDAFSATKPSSAFEVALFDGGKHWRFGSSTAFDGWVVPSSSWANQAIKLAPNQAMTLSANQGTSSWAVRAQIETVTAPALKPTGRVKITAGGYRLEWVPSAAGFSGPVLEVYLDNSLISVHLPCVWARDWLIVSVADDASASPRQSTLYVVADGEIVYTTTRTGVVALTGVTIANDAGSSTTISVRDVMVGKTPSVSITYADGSGDARQAQSHETAGKVVIQETVYDKTKTARFQTVPTRKRAQVAGDAYAAVNPTGFAFETNFVIGRNPADPSPDALNLWSTDGAYINAGSMAGLIQVWRFTELAGDTMASFYSYNAQYPQTDPLMRPKEATDSSNEFKIGTTNTVRATYGQDTTVTALLGATSIPASDRPRFTAESTSSPWKLTDTNPASYVRSISATASDVLGHTTIAGATSSSTTFSSEGDRILSASLMSYKADGGRTLTARMPNSYSSTLANADNYKVVSEVDRFGRVLSSTGPDRGTTKAVYDDLGRVRYSQDAVGAEKGFFAYTDYDREGRLTEAGLIARPFDAAILNAAANQAGWTTRENLQGAWSCNQASGTTLADQSGNAITGTLMGGAAFAAGGPSGYGQCLTLASASGQYVDLGNPVALQNLTDITISLWMKVTSPLATAGLVVGTTSLSGYISLAVRGSGQVDLVTGLEQRVAATLSTSQQTNWVHVLATGGASPFRLYFDGVLVNSATAGATLATGTFAWMIGASASNPTAAKLAFFNGSVSDVRIHRVAVSDAVARAIYLEGPRRPSSKVVYDTAPEQPVSLYNGLPAQVLTYNRLVTDGGAPDVPTGSTTAIAAEGLVAERYTYDVNKRVLKQITSVPQFDAAERTIEYGYDALGNVASVRYPA